ncbi:SPOSA6832_00380, partial [Sporobolomyces salmonicolor]
MYEAKVRPSSCRPRIPRRGEDPLELTLGSNASQVLKAEMWSKGSNKKDAVGPHYFVHYKGWKQTWDEWVPEERLNKYNEENIRKQKALIEAQRARDAAEREAQKAAEAENARRAAASGGAAGMGAALKRDDKRGLKRAREGEGVRVPLFLERAGLQGGTHGLTGMEWMSVQEEEYMRKMEVKIAIPDNLKTQLVDDWEAITKNQQVRRFDDPFRAGPPVDGDGVRQLVPLPRNPSVDVILDEWLKYLQNEEEDKKRLAAEVAAGLGLYFNKALGNNLLYRFERGQYQEQYKALQGTDKQMSSVYGGEHLLRLFVNLPELLAHTSLDPESMGVLKENMVQFLAWMDLNRRVLFVKEYNGTSSGYQNNNRG